MMQFALPIVSGVIGPSPLQVNFFPDFINSCTVSESFVVTSSNDELKMALAAASVHFLSKGL